MTGSLREIVLGISPDEASFARRKFHSKDEDARRYLETVGRTFIDGYHAALRDTDPRRLSSKLDQTRTELSGFAYEGAAMALTLLDCLTPWNRGRLARFLREAADDHIYMVHVGAGWALARLRRRSQSALERMHPVYRWLAIDGYGFHEGYFLPDKFVSRQEHPEGLAGYGRKAFDQGLGRSLWFSQGADATRISEVIARFSQERRADLWSGVGLACTYAGGVAEEDILMLKSPAADYLPQLAQGAAFAAKARIRARNLTPSTETACRILCGVSAEEAAAVTDRAMQGLPSESDVPAYEIWRQRIQHAISKEGIRI